MHERLVVVAHGSAAPAAAATIHRLLGALRADRPSVRVDLAFLDVVSPRLADVLDDRPTVVVPLLLSTGYHVQADIPAVVRSHPRTRVSPHLGPDPLLARALLDRLPGAPPDAAVVLVGAGSSRPDAAAELTTMAGRLGDVLGRAVPLTTIDAGLGDRLRALAPVRVATYLLAEGHFHDRIRAAVDGIGTAAEPIGAHPALVELVWQRYDDT